MRTFLILAGLLIGGRPAATDVDPEADPGTATDPAVAITAEPATDPAVAIRPELPAPGAGQPSAPACAALPDGAVLLVWESREDGGPADVLFSRRDPGPDGRWLPEPVRLDGLAPGAARSLEPRIAAGAGETVHVAWQDARDGADDIRVRRSPDGGRSWDPEIRVDGDPPGAAVSSMPALAADGKGRVYLAWEDQRHGDRDVYFARSTDGGRTFGPDARLDADAPGAGVSYHPDLLCRDDGTVLVFWRDERDGLADVYVRRSRDGGATWGPEKRLDGGPGDPGGSTASRHLGVAMVGDEIAAVWEEGGAEVLRSRSMDAGGAWTPCVRVAGDRRFDLREDPLTAAAAGRGVVPAAALTGGPLWWAGGSGERIWSVLRSETGLRVASGGISRHEVRLEAAATAAARPTGFAGTGLPDGGLFLVWVRKSDAGARLEAVALPGAPR